MLYKTVKCLKDISHSYSFLLVSNKRLSDSKIQFFPHTHCPEVTEPWVVPPTEYVCMHCSPGNMESQQVALALDYRKLFHCIWNMKPPVSGTTWRGILGEINMK